MLCTTANAEEYYFDPIMLETTKSGMQTTDLSRFFKKICTTTRNLSG
ncbi:Fimbrial usher family protein [Escherichia coli VL2874]|nr:Fimbrial usher family protein [Escherichia coli VL2874]